MGFDRRSRKMKQGLRRMYASPIEQNKVVKARRYGFLAATIAWVILIALSVGIYAGIKLAIFGG